MSDNNKMREAFENHADYWAACWWGFTRSGEEYCDDEVTSAWMHFKAGAAWQAAQAEQSVPVVGEVVGYLAGGTLMRRKIHGYDCKPLIIRPKNSITAAELERLRKDAERYHYLRKMGLREAGFKENMITFSAQDEAIDAAIAAEGEQE